MTLSNGKVLDLRSTESLNKILSEFNSHSKSGGKTQVTRASRQVKEMLLFGMGQLNQFEMELIPIIKSIIEGSKWLDESSRSGRKATTNLYK